MVFPSVPVYLDPPNWHQPPNQQHGATNENPQLPPLPPPPPHVGGASSIRPGSMADRARLAKLPQPEAGLKCPRCESTNTKFCYFNNYSLTQPRHFCKTCRRYWTRGGALRNVPVGGGCRRNKKSKSQQSSSKSPVSSERQIGGSSNSSSINSAIPSEIMGHFPQQPAQLPFISPLHNLSQFGVANIGLNFSGLATGSASGQSDMGFQLGGAQHFPMFETNPTGLYTFQSDQAGVEESLQHRPMNSSSRVSQLASVKMEDHNNQRLNLSRSFLGASENNQYWGGNTTTWTDLSGLNSTSTSHLL